MPNSALLTYGKRRPVFFSKPTGYLALRCWHMKGLEMFKLEEEDLVLWLLTKRKRSRCELIGYADTHGDVRSRMTCHLYAAIFVARNGRRLELQLGRLAERPPVL
ncbi:hypothetical protein GQ600_21167 [Phytophthora cactorum]|nr:hypothetical protein GQ600_21167 [Phytophthora cactorum]